MEQGNDAREEDRESGGDMDTPRYEWSLEWERSL